MAAVTDFVIKIPEFTAQASEILCTETGAILWSGSLTWRPDNGEHLWVNNDPKAVVSTALMLHSAQKGTNGVDFAILRIFVVSAPMS